MREQEDFCLIEQKYDELLKELNLISANPTNHALKSIKSLLKRLDSVQKTEILLGEWVQKVKRDAELHIFLDILVKIGMHKTAKTLQAHFFYLNCESQKTSICGHDTSFKLDKIEKAGPSVESPSAIKTNWHENGNGFFFGDTEREICKHLYNDNQDLPTLSSRTG